MDLNELETGSMLRQTPAPRRARSLRPVFVVVMGACLVSVGVFAYLAFRPQDKSNNSADCGTDAVRDPYADFVGVGTARVSVTPAHAPSGSWVNVSFSGVDPSWLTAGSGEYICTQDSYCKMVQELSLWVGVFVSSANVSQIGPQQWDTANPPWLATAPIKWKPVNTTSGSVRFYMEASREAIVFWLFGNGTTYPVPLARTAFFTFDDVDQPHHVHIARTQSSSEMRVMWQSKHLDDDAMVKYGFSAGHYTLNATGIPSTYTKDDLCGPPATTHGWKDPGWMYSAIVKGLSQGSVVYYVVGSDAHGWSNESHFKAPQRPDPSATLKITAIADLGETYIDGAQYHWMEPYAINTTNHMITAWSSGTQPPRGMKRLALNPHERAPNSGRNSPPQGHILAALRRSLNSPNKVADGLDNTDLVLHIGDISYATGYASEWDRFMAEIAPIASRVPYMTGQGNHERDFVGTGSYGGDDSGGECGLPTQARFIMPTQSKKQDPGWYSFDQGPVHFVMLNTEYEVGAGSTQFAFLSSDLTNVNRSLTPWVIVMGHRPMYTGNHIDPRFQAFEPLLLQHKVDLCLYGHVHNAQRTCPVYNGTCVTQPDSTGYLAPVHAVIGNAGQSLSPFPSEKAAWSLYEAKEFGYSTLEVTGSSELRMRFYSDIGNELHHEFVIAKTRAVPAHGTGSVQAGAGARS